MYKRDRLYPTQLLFSDDICNIRVLYMVTIATFVHKSRTDENVVHHNYQTRARVNKDLLIPMNYKSLNLKSIVYLGPKVYNLLPVQMKNVKNMNTFKKRCN